MVTPSSTAGEKILMVMVLVNMQAPAEAGAVLCSPDELAGNLLSGHLVLHEKLTNDGDTNQFC